MPVDLSDSFELYESTELESFESELDELDGLDKFMILFFLTTEEIDSSESETHSPLLPALIVP